MKNNKDVDSLSHTTWRCQYHVVFAPKYRRMVIYGQIKKDIGQILRKLCEQKDIEIIEAEACPDHIHMLISFSPKYSISYVMGYLKGKSSLMIFDRHANLKYKYGNRISGPEDILWILLEKTSRESRSISRDSWNKTRLQTS